MTGPELVQPALVAGCRCGTTKFEVSRAFGPVLNCHCPFCRRVHGAAFTTVAFVPRAAIRWVLGEGEASVYLTPQGNHRFFCGACASPLFNAGGGGDLAAVVVASLRDDQQPAPWADVNTESKAPWYALSGELPAYPSWPAARELRALARANGCDWLPPQLLLPEPGA